jgi:hypothetical protein
MFSQSKHQRHRPVNSNAIPMPYIRPLHHRFRLLLLPMYTMTLPFYHPENSFGLHPNPNPAETPNPQSETHQQQSQPVKCPATGSRAPQETDSARDIATHDTMTGTSQGGGTSTTTTISTGGKEIDISGTSLGQPSTTTTVGGDGGSGLTDGGTGKETKKSWLASYDGWPKEAIIHNRSYP